MVFSPFRFGCLGYSTLTDRKYHVRSFLPYSNRKETKRQSQQICFISNRNRHHSRRKISLYTGDVKMMEGVPTKESIEKALKN
jgi:hypothetical protein